MLSNLALRLSMLRARLLPRRQDGRKKVPQRDALLAPDELVTWIHAPKAQAIPARAVAEDLIGRDPELPVLLTHPDGDVEAEDLPDLLTLDAPLDTNAALRDFLKEWRPPIALIFSDVAEPDLILQLRQSSASVLLYAPETNDPGLGLPSSNKLVLRGLLRQVTSALAESEVQAARLVTAGLPATQSLVTGPLPRRASPKQVDVITLQQVAAQLAGRPSWLAIDISPEEDDLLLEAYESTAQKAHRSLLIVRITNPDRVEEFLTKSRAHGRHVVLRSQTDQILAETQIVIADRPEEEELWYRVAPLTFMGRTLKGEGGLQDPFLPACLGSAILHGPRFGKMADAYQQLGRVGAARVVRDIDQLSRVLLELQAADKVAQMAHSAWDLATESAEATTRVTEAVLSEVALRKAG